MAPRRFPCPCCGHLTLDREPGGTFDLCPVCFWEDDPIQFDDHDYQGGANTVSLTLARKNFREFGASERQFIDKVRPPQPDEMP
jgi:Cysteine-rich CPCC